MKFTIFLFLIATMVAAINAIQIAIHIARNSERQTARMQVNLLQQKLAKRIIHRQRYANKLFF